MRKLLALIGVFCVAAAAAVSAEHICTEDTCADGFSLQRNTSTCCTGTCVADKSRQLFEPAMDCSLVRCGLPVRADGTPCESYFTSPGQCCPACCEPECRALCPSEGDQFTNNGGSYRCCGGEPCVKDCAGVSCPAPPPPEDCPRDRLVVAEDGCCPVCLETCKRSWNLNSRPQNCNGRVLLDSDCRWVCECDPSTCPPVECPRGTYLALEEGDCCPACKETAKCKECCREDQVEYYEEGASCPTCLTCQTFAPVKECESYQTRVYSPDQPCGVCEPDCTNVECEAGNRNNGHGANGNGQKKGHGPKCENGEVFVRDKGQCCSGSCQPDCSTVLCIAIACEENQVPIYEGCCITRCESYCDKQPRPVYDIVPGYTLEPIPGKCWEMNMVPLEPCAGLECVKPDKCPEGQHLSTLPGECCPQCRACGVHEVLKWEVEVNGAMCKRPCGEPIVEKVCAGGCRAGEDCCGVVGASERVEHRVSCFKEWRQPQWYDDVYYAESAADCRCQG